MSRHMKSKKTFVTTSEQNLSFKNDLRQLTYTLYTLGFINVSILILKEQYIQPLIGDTNIQPLSFEGLLRSV